MAREDQYLQIQQVSGDRSGTEEASGEDLFDLLFDSGETALPEESTGPASGHLPFPFLKTFISNPLLFDLPPPASHT
jgi:hypothetical protein